MYHKAVSATVCGVMLQYPGMWLVCGALAHVAVHVCACGVVCVCIGLLCTPHPGSARASRP